MIDDEDYIRLYQEMRERDQYYSRLHWALKEGQWVDVTTPGLIELQFRVMTLTVSKARVEIRALRHYGLHPGTRTKK